MSHPYQRRLSLTGIDLARLSVDELRALVRTLIDRGIHGISFSPYIEGQGPGTELGEDQIRERLEIIRPHVEWIRSFSCTDGNQNIPRIAKDMGLKTLAGVWIDENRERNELELQNGIEIAKAGHVDILAVGNEVLLREELADEELVSYLRRAQSEVAGVPVGYVDAYYLFELHPSVADACDVILANCYPFWEGCPAEFALLYMKDMYRRALRAAKGKKVVISETGWPNVGSPTHGAVPSFENAIKYFIDTYQWADEDGVEIFYFSSFDEVWKVADEGDVGAYWGIWDKDGKLKYA
ncbi:MAG: glycosyl hydrolase family 17 protein [Myxococcota bacterium]